MNRRSASAGMSVRLPTFLASRRFSLMAWYMPSRPMFACQAASSTDMQASSSGNTARLRSRSAPQPSTSMSSPQGVASSVGCANLAFRCVRRSSSASCRGMMAVLMNDASVRGNALGQGEISEFAVIFTCRQIEPWFPGCSLSDESGSVVNPC